MPHVLIMTCEEDPEWIDVTIHATQVAAGVHLANYLVSDLTIQGERELTSEEGDLIGEIVHNVSFRRPKFSKNGYGYQLVEADYAN